MILFYRMILSITWYYERPKKKGIIKFTLVLGPLILPVNKPYDQ